MRIKLCILSLLLSSLVVLGQTTTSRKSAQDQFTDAQQKLQNGQPAAAIALLQPLANATPPVKGAAHELGVAYYRTGKLTDALQAFTQAEKEDPNDMESVQLHGLTLYRLGRPADAIPFLKRVRQWMPNADADANHVLGLCYLNSQQYDEARKTFAEQYSVQPDSGAAYLFLGNMLMQANLPEQAKTAAVEALKIAPQLPLAHFMIGEVDLFKSDVNGALQEFEQERAINPAYPATYDRLGDVDIHLGKYQEAQQALTKALSLDTSSTGPFILMGKVLLLRGDAQTSIMYLRHAAKMDPNNFMTHALLSQAYRKVGNEEDAKREVDLVSKIHAAERLKLQPAQ
ncbi:MAG TPA: tetratricopeptide repeat protein [Acidobacteriaceae bacterium]|nr:tetratricopeptide repeat protein [Acidobacteriaceae bacterium]